MDNMQLDKEFQINHQEDNYYNQYVRLYLANIVLTSQVKELVDEKNALLARLSKYQDQEASSFYDRNQDRNRRFRRTAQEIQRFYKCSVKNCQKSYGSEGSLNQHYKLKHPEIYVSLPSVQSSKQIHQSEGEKPKRKTIPKGIQA